MKPIFFEDYAVGESRTSAGRTLTEADIVMHAGQTGDFYPHHMDAEWCKTQDFKQRIAHGTLVFSIAAGQTAGVINPAAFSYGYDRLRFVRPVFIGDTRFLHDLRKTISELIVDNFFGVFAELAREKNCTFSSECVAPVMTADGLFFYDKVDVPMGEFWLRSATHDKLNDMLERIDQVFAAKVGDAKIRHDFFKRRPGARAMILSRTLQESGSWFPAKGRVAER
ncbi:MAG: MaoC/PaaZ C-terminal domain-containing protein [Opitutaceae bacterium]